ncbi:MAG: energy-coupling factor transporter ATPase [Candidatus Hadarchaeum sp.]
MALIEFKNYGFRYRGFKRKALSNINLQIDGGSVVGLIGRAGAGKTTLLKSLIGIIPFVDAGEYEGEVIVNGLRVKEQTIGEMARYVSIVLENPEVQIFSLTVRDDIAFGPANLGLPLEEIEKRVQYALEQAELKGFEERNPNDLSGGEQQSLAIAGALAMMPRVLTLDEPVAMLDPVGKERVLSVVEHVARRGSDTLTIISEAGADIEAVAERVDRVITLHKGEVIQDGPRSLFADPILDEIGVGRPQVSSLFSGLREAGVPVNHIPVTLDEAVMEMKRLLDEQGIDRIQLPPLYSQRQQPRTFGEEIVRVENLHHVYIPNIHALKGVSMSVRSGEILGIIGQNGSGKTTLARHLVGLLKPTNRDAVVQVMGKDVTKMDLRQVIKMINYVFQNPDDQIFADTVWEEVAFAPMMMDIPEEEAKALVQEAIEVFRLKGHESDYTMSLPEDLKTFLAIASILPLKPRILLIDEPTTGLDTWGAQVMMDSIEQLRAAGHTIIIITHTMKTVARYCDRVLVMNRGEIIADGPTREVFSRPEKLLEADIKPPQITQLGQKLADRGFPGDVLTVEEMQDILLYNLKPGEA